MERLSLVVGLRLRSVCDDRVRQGCSLKLLNSEHRLLKAYHPIQLFSAFSYARIRSRQDVSVPCIPLVLWENVFFKICFLLTFSGWISYLSAVIQICMTANFDLTVGYGYRYNIGSSWHHQVVILDVFRDREVLIQNYFLNLIAFESNFQSLDYF